MKHVQANNMILLKAWLSDALGFVDKLTRGVFVNPDTHPL